MVHLVYTDDEGTSQTFKLGELSTLGRNPDQSIQILDRVVSKSHAVIEKLSDGQYWLRDKESRNGTYLNSVRLSNSKRLCHGDEIRIGSTVLVFCLDDPPEDVVDATDGGGESLVQQKSLHECISYDEEMSTSSIFTSYDELSLDEMFRPEKDIKNESVLRRDYERLRIAHELSRTIFLETNRDAILTRIVDSIIESVAADRVLVMLRDDIADLTTSHPPISKGPTKPFSMRHNSMRHKREHETLDAERLVVVLLRTSGSLDSFHTVHVSRTILNQVLKERRAIRSEDALADERFRQSQSIVFDRIRSTMTVPLMRDDEVLGVIHLDSKRGLGIFSEKDLVILIGLAHQISLLLEHILLLKQMEEEIVMREGLYRLLPPRIVEEVLAGHLDLEKKSTQREVTVMFVDIRGFTKMSETLEPDELVIQLNEYFEAMVDVVFRHGGTLDKLIGDEIMAVWGAPIEVSNGPQRAVECALEMLVSLETLNRIRATRQLPAIEVGIGINTGTVVAGYMGSSKSLDYTVTGDTVNVAARLCERALGGQILVGCNTWHEIAHIAKGFRLEDSTIRGKSEPVGIYMVEGLG